MKRIVLVLGLLAGILLLNPATAHACSCTSLTVAEQTARADTVMGATVAWVSSNGLDTTYGVEVAEVFKGQSASFEKLRTPASEAACGLGNVATGDRFLFFADGEHPGQMQVDACGGSAPFEAAVSVEVIKITGAPGGPQFSPLGTTGPVDPDPIAGTSVWNVVGTALVIALALGGMLWLAKR